ncbi:MAG: hypothetical protein WC383_11705 [Gammaproteobacteria bacterium]
MARQNHLSCMMIDKTASALDLYDAIYERLTKAIGVVVSCQARDDINPTLSDALWCVQGLLDEAMALHAWAWEVCGRKATGYPAAVAEHAEEA